MISRKNWDIDSLLVNNNDRATRISNKFLPRPSCYKTPNLTKSIESLEEIDIPRSSFIDPEMHKLMSELGSPRYSRYEVVSYASTLRAGSPVACLPSNRESAGSLIEFAGQIPQLCQQRPDYKPQSLRPNSLLPESHFEYRPLSYWRDSDETTLYSATLRTSSSSPYEPVAFHRNQSFAKRGVTPLQLESLCSDLDSDIFSYQASCCSSEARPSTPTSRLVPSLSFCSTADSSPSSIMTYTSSQDMAQSYGIVEHVEQPKVKKSKNQLPRLILGDTNSRANARARNISPPIPSPKFPDANTAAAFSYDRTLSSRSCAPTPSPVPTLRNEVSSFDWDSDGEEGGLSHRLKSMPKTVKSAASFQNLRKQPRPRAESASRPPPMPTAVIISHEYTSVVGIERSSKGSAKLRNSKESKEPASPTPAPATPTSPAKITHVACQQSAHTFHHLTASDYNRTSSEPKPSSPISKFQNKASVYSKRSNTVTSARAPPSPPPNTPLPPTPTLEPKRQGHMLWYSCFQRADNTAANNYINAAQKKCKSKNSGHVGHPGKLRVLMRRVFRLKK